MFDIEIISVNYQEEKFHVSKDCSGNNKQLQEMVGPAPFNQIEGKIMKISKVIDNVLQVD